MNPNEDPRLKRCICLHRDHDHAQLPTGEYAGPCMLCGCVDFKSIGGLPLAPPSTEKTVPADRENLERLLAKRLRRRFETLFDEETLGTIAAALIQSAWSLGWEEGRQSLINDRIDAEEFETPPPAAAALQFPTTTSPPFIALVADQPKKED